MRRGDGHRDGHQRRPGAARRAFGVDGGEPAGTGEPPRRPYDEPHQRTGQPEAQQQHADGVHGAGHDRRPARNVERHDERPDDDDEPGDHSRPPEHTAGRRRFGHLALRHRLDGRDREHRPGGQHRRRDARHHARQHGDNRRAHRQVVPSPCRRAGHRNRPTRQRGRRGCQSGTPMSPPARPYTADSPRQIGHEVAAFGAERPQHRHRLPPRGPAMFIVLNTRKAAITSEISDTRRVASRVTEVAVSICLAGIRGRRPRRGRRRCG